MITPVDWLASRLPCLFGLSHREDSFIVTAPLRCHNSPRWLFRTAVKAGHRYSA